ncbi:hypothetical protein [Tahibacter amnicola]|uniref:Uncharacterized protein n=1 Tax=Tahibacter amnicola TaxID=2976241 RepID=A0ABY6BDL6_9GAMM|nr:hypothetical protein [Tahibacter amnicola]UXI67949.1 hypothetical protein N4264_25015 [Tahibacter amnicola]
MNSSPHGLPADEFCLADVLVNAFDADADSAETIVDAARGRRDRALAGLRTLAAVLRWGRAALRRPGMHLFTAWARCWRIWRMRCTP